MNQPTASPLAASFLDAYLVAEDSMGSPPVGVVRKERNVWKILPVRRPDRAAAAPGVCHAPSGRRPADGTRTSGLNGLGGLRR
jgi:hypothetical protein